MDDGKDDDDVWRTDLHVYTLRSALSEPPAREALLSHGALQMMKHFSCHPPLQHTAWPSNSAQTHCIL
jgi:hypothetical protein